MNRRELLKLIAAATGGVVIGGEFLLSGCKNPESTTLVFTQENIAFLDEVAETILPQTNTAGAKAAGCDDSGAQQSWCDRAWAGQLCAGGGIAGRGLGALP